MAVFAAVIIAAATFGIMMLVSNHYIQTQIDTIENTVYKCEQVVFDLQQAEKLTEDEQKELEFLNEYMADLRYLNMLYTDSEKNAEEIIEQRYQLNQMMLEKAANGESINPDFLTAPIEELQKENNEYEAYWEKEISPPVNPIEPNMVYVLTTNLNGYTPFMIVILLVLGLCLNNTWSEDWEYRTRTLYMALPYSKPILFVSRFLTNMIASFMTLAIALVALGMISTVCCGTGSYLIVEVGNRYMDLSHIMLGLVLSNMELILVYSVCLQFLSITIRNTIDLKIWASSLLIIDYFVLQSQRTFHLGIENVWSLHGLIVAFLLFVFMIFLGFVSKQWFIHQR